MAHFHKIPMLHANIANSVMDGWKNVALAHP